MSTALQNIEKLHAGILQKVMLPGRKLPEPSLLRTHPYTHERIERLDKVGELQQEPHMSVNDSWQAGFFVKQ